MAAGSATLSAAGSWVRKEVEPGGRTSEGEGKEALSEKKERLLRKKAMGA